MDIHPHLLENLKYRDALVIHMLLLPKNTNGHLKAQQLYELSHRQLLSLLAIPKPKLVLA